jgi:MFS transporter, ACS family, hexuronate transporter
VRPGNSNKVTDRVPLQTAELACKPEQAQAGALATSWRWEVVLLLFLATSINYVDRAVLGVLKPELESQFQWDQKDFGWIVTAFQAAYALGYVLAGRWFDRIGARAGLLLAVAVWSCAAVAHAFAGSVFGFALARAILGLAEGGFFPAAIRAIAEWFPRQERALATGLFNSGSNAGAVTCPLVVPLLAAGWGWQGAFVATGALGFVWLVFWALRYHPPEANGRVSASELAWIRQDPPDPALTVRWLELLRHRQTWAFMAGMAASSPVWWFFIYWTPDFLNKRFHLNMTGSSLPLTCIFLVSSFGGILGGWLSSRLLRRGWTVNAARKTTLLICSLCALPIFGASFVNDAWCAVGLVALAAAAHCGYAANLFTLVSDTVPRFAVSSVVGIGGLAGSLAGILFVQVVSRTLHYTNNNYFIPFAMAASAYFVGLAIMHALLPRIEPMKLAS